MPRLMGMWSRSIVSCHPKHSRILLALQVALAAVAKIKPLTNVTSLLHVAEYRLASVHPAAAETGTIERSSSNADSQ